jgi:hypothetical protein
MVTQLVAHGQQTEAVAETLDVSTSSHTILLG